MNKFLLSFTFISALYSAQTGNVGINTAAPVSTLDIKSTAPATKTEGLLIPRLKGDEIKAMPVTASTHESLLVYATNPVTTANSYTQYITGPGFYFLQGTTWVPLAVGEPWNIKNSNTRATLPDASQDIYRIGKVAIGDKNDTTNSYLTVKGTQTDGMYAEIHMLNPSQVDFDYKSGLNGTFIFRNNTAAASSVTNFVKTTNGGDKTVLTWGHDNSTGFVNIPDNLNAGKTNTGQLKSTGMVTLPYKTVNASYTVTDSDYTIRIFNDVGYVTLPDPTQYVGRILVLIGSNGISTKNINGPIYDDVNNQTITTIGGNQRITIQSDGTTWIVIFDSH